MFPDEEASPDDLAADSTSSGLRATADIFEQSAAATAGHPGARSSIGVRKLYRETTALSQQSDTEVDYELA